MLDQGFNLYVESSIPHARHGWLYRIKFRIYPTIQTFSTFNVDNTVQSLYFYSFQIIDN